MRGFGWQMGENGNVKKTTYYVAAICDNELDAGDRKEKDQEVLGKSTLGPINYLPPEISIFTGEIFAATADKTVPTFPIDGT
ncbi:hypothetical protein M413DRAFT_257748 [Hebeloma cylindrosporum]|uniref:Uncharacterized protein n=1 Tax=Hebeloma cylindrosporum TaxID=76867 RepID=A0A0C3BLK8_HEBCY|nr:hypothetical protein M413DRAFT_257748 [Hebeloma cylindrosporum h7]